MSRRWLATGVIEAPVDAVFAALLTVGPAATAHRRGDPADATSTVTVEIDQKGHTLAVQGRWWYRGVYTVREHPRGSLLEYRVHNVATRGRWAVPLMQHRLPHQMRHDLATLLQTMSRHLGRPAYSDPDGSHDEAGRSRN